MNSPLDINAQLAARLRRRDNLVGSFVKTPQVSIVEIMARSGFDFLVLDAEHGSFDRASIDTCILAGLAWGCPVMVRIPVAEPDWIMFSLDCGAAGLFLPHVSDKERAEKLAGLVSFAPQGKRGFSPSVRAGSYGKHRFADYLRDARARFSLICQIEDLQGVESAAAVAAVEGVDGIFVGPADLAVSCGYDDMEHPEALALCERALVDARDHAATSIFVPDLPSALRWRSAQPSFVLVGSDHTMLAAGAAAKLRTSRPVEGEALK